jgi:hypothetical protein
MGRPKTAEIVKIRQQILKLSNEEIEELQTQIEIILEVRESGGFGSEASNGKQD